MKINLTRWKISPVPTQRQVKEIRRLSNVRKVTRDGEFSIVHYTATGYARETMLVRSLGAMGFEVVGHAGCNEGMALAKRWKK
jgi:hypothetical protein